MKRKWQIFWHIIFWISIVSYFTFVTHNNSKISLEGLLVIFGVYGFINIGLFYLNFLYLIPKFLNKKKYELYASSLFVAIIIFGLGKYGIAWLYKPILLAHTSGKT